jgi:hypothetical protein
MKKTWDLGRHLQIRWDWYLFGLTALCLLCWGSWYLSPLSSEPRFRLEWKEGQPAQEITLGELRDYISVTSRRCEELKREVKSLRGIRPGSLAEKQFETLVATSSWNANTETFIQYTFNQRVNPDDRQEPRFVPFTERQQRIIQFGDVLDAAYSLRSNEGLLTALVAASAAPTNIDGYYTNYRDMELLVNGTAQGYQVRMGGAYGLSLKSYGYDFTASRIGETLTAQARLMPEHLAEEAETVVIRFDRGIAEISGQSPFARGTMVKVANLRSPGYPLDPMVALGAGPCSPDEWEARANFLRSDVVWTSEARPALFWHAYYIYQVSDEALGGPRRKR